MNLKNHITYFYKKDSHKLCGSIMIFTKESFDFRDMKKLVQSKFPDIIINDIYCASSIKSNLSIKELEIEYEKSKNQTLEQMKEQYILIYN